LGTLLGPEGTGMVAWWPLDYGITTGIAWIGGGGVMDPIVF